VASAAQALEAKQLRALAIASKKRSSAQLKSGGPSAPYRRAIT